MIKECKFKGMDYLMSFPDSFDESKQYPLIIFLHGSGTRGHDVSVLYDNHGFSFLTQYKNEDCIVVAPQCAAVAWTEVMETLIGLVSFLRNTEYVDTARVYLTGNSMGGYGSWELACIHPEYFAAVMPLCGGGTPWLTERMIHVPVRAFHGLRDSAVKPSESLEMVAALNRFGGYAELILFPELGHNCWDRVYSDASYIDWLLTHKSEGIVAGLPGFNSKELG